MTKGLIINGAGERTGVANYVNLILKYSKFDYDILNISVFTKSRDGEFPMTSSGRNYFFETKGGIWSDLLSIFTGLFRRRLSLFVSNIGASYDFVLISQQDWSFLAPIFYKRNSNRVVVTVHDAGIFRYRFHPYRFLLNFNFKRLKREEIAYVMYDSKLTMEKINEKYGVGNKGMLVELTVDPLTYYKRDKLECRRKLKLPLDKTLILSVGRDTYVKNLPALLLSIPFIDADQFILVRVGKLDNSLKYYESLPAEVKSKIVIIDDVDNNTLPLYYGASDIFVFPSPIEGFGLELIEAIFSGNLVVTVNSAPMNDIVAEYGYFVENAKDHQELAKVISKAISEIREGKGIKSISPEWSKRFSIERFISEVESCLMPGH
jgi:glycosyltransferase involved in cell wall biosynthesis